jgi:hypothetical protein
MVALGRWSGGAVALALGLPDSRRWTISSWRGASVDDEREREEVGKRRSVDVS